MECAYAVAVEGVQIRPERPASAFAVAPFGAGLSGAAVGLVRPCRVNLVEERPVRVPVPEIGGMVHEVHAVETVAAKIHCRVFGRFLRRTRHLAAKSVKVDTNLLERTEVSRHVGRTDCNRPSRLGASSEYARRICPRPVTPCAHVGAGERAEERAAHFAMCFAVVAQRHLNIVASRPSIAVPFALPETQDVGRTVELPDGNASLAVSDCIPPLTAPVAEVAVSDWLACVGAVVKLRAIRID